jgi:capsular polysaccharide biosynthesis protein
MKIVRKIIDKTSFKNKLPENFDPKDRWLFDTHINTYIHEVKLYADKNVVFLPDHIVTKGLKIWRGEMTNHYLDQKMYVIKRGIKALLRGTIKLKGKYILVTDDWSWSYFHWTGDVLPKVYLVKDQLKDYTVLLPESFKNHQYILESLSLFNAKLHFFSPAKNLRIEELMIPSPVGSSGVFNYDVLKGLSRFIRTHEKVKQQNARSPERIYISRGKAKYRKILNEDELITLLVSLDFEIIYTEKLTLIQQVQLVSNCKWLISQHGAGLTNELYLSPGSNVLEIRHPEDHLNNCYYLMATALELNYHYFLGQADNKDPHYADVTVDLPSFLKCVQNFLAVDHHVQHS